MGAWRGEGRLSTWWVCMHVAHVRPFEERPADARGVEARLELGHAKRRIEEHEGAELPSEGCGRRPKRGGRTHGSAALGGLLRGELRKAKAGRAGGS